MELRQVRSFLVVAETLHFGRAAGAINISQPGLSQQIRRLERELGAALLDRSGRTVALTAAGEVLVAGARALLKQADRAAAAVQRAASGRPPLLTVGFLAQAAADATSAIFLEFARRQPNITLQFRALRFTEHLRCLRDRTVDVALLRPPYGDEELAGIALAPLVTEPRVAVLPSGHQLARRDSCTFADIADETWVRLPEDASPVWRAFWRVDERRAGRPVRLCEQEVDNIEEVLTVVGLGEAITTTHASIATYYARPSVAFVPLLDVPPSTLAVGWHLDFTEPYITDFVEAAAAALTDGISRAGTGRQRPST